MTDKMRWFYDNHIQPYIKAQAKDSADLFHASSLKNALDSQERKDLEQVVAFHAVRGFRLGLTLSDELRDKEPV